MTGGNVKDLNFDTIIVGAGAAGLMCAIEAGKRGRKVLLIDHAKNVGEKIRISGGGRCNFTNRHASPANYLSNNPHFCVSALKRYTQYDFVELVENYKIDYHEKTLGQYFCDDSSKQIIELLLTECEAANVTIFTNSKISNVAKHDDGFQVRVGEKRTLNVESVVIATGGPSIPKMGATSWGYDIAKQFGLNVIQPKPALVPFTLGEKMLEKLKPLSGVSLDATASCNGVTFKEALLFTHRGLSGPVILQISSYWQEKDVVTLNLLPDINVLAKLKSLRETNAKQEIHTVLASLLPKRLAHYICGEHGYQGTLAEMSNQQLQNITATICDWKITPSGTEGYRTAEVTLGGVDTNELSSKTFESKKVPGLYFIGEVIDVTGHLGGYNFQWAWSSGHAAGQFV